MILGAFSVKFFRGRDRKRRENNLSEGWETGAGMKMKVFITDYVAPPAVFEERVLSDIADVVCLQETNEAALRGKVEAADGLIVFHKIVLTSRSIN